MHRYFLEISYKGTNYHGWQKQPNVPSIQETFESKVEKLLGRKVHCQGCGRTDKGVHASQFYLHLDLDEKESNRIHKLAKLLPEDISLLSVNRLTEKRDAQLDVQTRSYQYYLHFQKDPFLASSSALYDKEDYKLDVLEKAFYSLKEVRDFEYFCKTPNNYKHTNCEIRELNFKIEKGILCLTFSADRFLRSMIRYLVASLLDVASQKISIQEWQSILKKDKKLPHRKEAFPQGLYLAKVTYPFLTNCSTLESKNLIFTK